MIQSFFGVEVSGEEFNKRFTGIIVTISAIFNAFLHSTESYTAARAKEPSSFRFASVAVTDIFGLTFLAIVLFNLL
jgi:hypothetical protein